VRAENFSGQNFGVIEFIGGNVIDLVALHKKLGCKKNLGNFLNSTAYRQCVDALHRRGLMMTEIMVYVRPAKNTPSLRRVHPVVALEYLRWADYDRYIGQAFRLVAKNEDSADNE